MSINDIISVETETFQGIDGKKVRKPVFNKDEKERASKIVEQLKGLTIYEARELLDKISNAILAAVNTQTLD